MQIAVPAGNLSTEQQANLTTLQGLSGEAFDDAYLDRQVAAHENTVRMFQDFIAHTPDSPLRQWAQATLPKLQEHLTQVQALENAT